MPSFYVPALLLALTASLSPVQEPAAGGAGTRDPQLISTQTAPAMQGKCRKTRFESAYLSLDIDVTGSPQQIGFVEAPRPGIGDMALEVVRQDHFAPALKDGIPVKVSRKILVEMHTCEERVAMPDGGKQEHTVLESVLRQTIYSTPPLFPSAGAPGVYKMGAHISPPIAISSPQAQFTPEARREKVQGEAIISLVVDIYGMPQNPRVIKPLPAGLTESALAAVRQYRFKPAMKDGKTPLPMVITIAVNFRL